VVRQVTAADPLRLVDGILAALYIKVSRDKVIEGGIDSLSGGLFSIKVGRYFEFGGNRYVIGEPTSDPFLYTMLRILETAGYRVVTVAPSNELTAQSRHLLQQLGITFAAGRYRLTPKTTPFDTRELSGVMTTLPGEIRVFLTDTAFGPGEFDRFDGAEAELISSILVK
jgi:hypothetical protein